MRRLAALLVSLTACADAPAAGDKPASDPDTAVLSGKADGLSDYWTDIRGELAAGQRITETIDFPSYYFGRTVELRAGQRFQIDLVSNRKSLVRVYGPATGDWDGWPTFGAALVKADTRRANGKQASSFAFDVPADGTYMLVYGPENVWRADYQIDLTCTAGCATASACEGDYDCQAGEFCGDNGVRCVRAPCDANYDVCQARHGSGAVCARDGECKDGFACRGGSCAAEVCSSSDDCQHDLPGFCGCADGACSTSICKDYAAEGESCGGFRMAHLTRFCAPDVECVAPHDIIADIPGHCGESTTVAEVLADPRAFDGHFIAIKGVFDPGAAMCTKLGCSPTNPCCNNCGADMRVFDDRDQVATGLGIYLSEDGANLGCQGNECTWADHCAVAAGNTWVAGWFRLESGVTPRLEIVARYAY